MNMSILDLFMWQFLRGLASVPAMFLNHPESLKWSPFDTVDCCWSKKCRGLFGMYQTLQSVIYIYIHKLLKYIALQKTDSSFFCEIGGKERHAFPFWGTSARKKGTDSIRAQCVHPPVNWISTQKSSKGIESKSTKFDLAAKAPEKLPFGE